MNTIKKLSIMTVLIAGIFSLTACENMTPRQQRGTAIGAVGGGVAGAVLGGGVLGTAAGAGLGGLIGNQVTK